MNRQAGMIVVAMLLGLALPAAAAMDLDPKAPMRWEDLIGCESIVVATYDKHDATGLYLRVVRTLKGPARTGEVLHVRLEHRYSLQTGPTGWERFGGNDKRNNIPHLL